MYTARENHFEPNETINVNANNNRKLFPNPKINLLIANLYGCIYVFPFESAYQMN